MKKAQSSKLKTQSYNLKLKTFALCAFLLHFALCTLRFPSPALAVLGAPPPKTPYAQNQIIVKYKQGSSPKELEILVRQRQIKRQNFFGLLSLFWENLKFRLKKEETPETRLARLKQVEQQAGVKEKEKLFKSEEVSLENFYLIKTDGRLKVEEVVNLYRQLPEVEFAEPNYLYSIMGI